MALDFSHQNLRGQSFRGQDLTGVNFSSADIRGADFSRAILKEANFSEARAGLKAYWVFVLLMLSLFIAAFSGFTSAILTTFTVNFFTSKRIPTPVVALVATIFILLVRWNLNLYLGCDVVAWNVNLSIAIILAVVFFGAPAAAIDEPEAKVGGIALVTFASMAVLIVVTTNIITEQCTQLGGLRGGLVGGAFGGIIGSWFSRLAIDGDKKFNWIWKLYIHLASLGGSKFGDADLTDADFTLATLKGSDFKRANLTRTRWFRVKHLDLAYAGDSYLKYSKVQKLLTTLQGQNHNFSKTNLSGVNLKDANLQDANFIGADLNYATLQDVDLSRAQLKQTQLDKTDLTGATLTGTYIEDWGITRDTKLDEVRCEYVYTHIPTKEDPDPMRKPDNRKEIFVDKDFADFIRPLVNTLDLYHNQGVDPRASAIALKDLAQNNPDAQLDLVATEKRGRVKKVATNAITGVGILLDVKLLLRVRTSGSADKSKLSELYFRKYNQVTALPQDNIQLLLAEKDDRIRSLENMLITALKQPNLYAENYQNQGAYMAEQSNTNIIGHDVTGSTINLGEISGNVSNVINQLSSSSELGQPSIKELLTQLQQVIESETELLPEDKADLLVQVKSLAEAQTTPNQERKKGLVRNARKIFDATLKGLPDTAKIIEACSKLLPPILKVLGFPA